MGPAPRDLERARRAAAGDSTAAGTQRPVGAGPRRSGWRDGKRVRGRARQRQDVVLPPAAVLPRRGPLCAGRAAGARRPRVPGGRGRRGSDRRRNPVGRGAADRHGAASRGRAGRRAGPGGEGAARADRHGAAAGRDRREFPARRPAAARRRGPSAGRVAAGARVAFPRSGVPVRQAPGLALRGFGFRLAGAQTFRPTAFWTRCGR